MSRHDFNARRHYANCHDDACDFCASRINDVELSRQLVTPRDDELFSRRAENAESYWRDVVA